MSPAKKKPSAKPPAKSKARKAAPGKAAPRRAAPKRAPAKKAKPPRAAKISSIPGEREALIRALAKKLSLPAAEVELRALRELANRTDNAEAEAPPPGMANGAPSGVLHGGPPTPAQPAVQPGPHEGGLPLRLYLLLDGRGLDGHGLPIEVIESTITVGSGKFCTVWVNSPQIETRHLQIKQEGEAWVLSDLGTAHGTLLGAEPLAGPHVIQHGDEYRLAGYLRMRTELR